MKLRLARWRVWATMLERVSQEVSEEEMEGRPLEERGNVAGVGE